VPERFRSNGPNGASHERSQSPLRIFKLKSPNSRPITLPSAPSPTAPSPAKVTEKGGVSVYGLGRFPVTLYGSQWDKLAANMPAIMAFVDANRALPQH